MRPRQLKRGALALLLLLAGATAGCGWDFNLTPFGGVQEPISGKNNINGLWAGFGSSGGTVEFQVSSETMVSLTLKHLDAAGCAWNYRLTDSKIPIIDRTFTVENSFADQGRFVLTGTFTDPSTCRGNYTFDGLTPAGTCPTTGSVQFAVYKQP